MKNKVKVGKIYNVNHSRKGRFILKIISVNDEWITGELIEGDPKYLSEGAYSVAGEEMTLRESFCEFQEVSNG